MPAEDITNNTWKVKSNYYDYTKFYWQKVWHISSICRWKPMPSYNHTSLPEILLTSIKQKIKKKCNFFACLKVMKCYELQIWTMLKKDKALFH
jgi:hypothetical protein